jgi:anti-sigma regulatory factor (Ser/Thr protein kinase)
MQSDPRFLSVVRSTIGRLASVLGGSDEESTATMLAIDEALTNVIRHSYHGAQDRPIRLICDVRNLGLNVRIIDQGAPPNMAKVCACDPAAPEPGGRGTHVIREVMDVVRYEKTRAGNQLRLRKEFRKQT